MRRNSIKTAIVGLVIGTLISCSSPDFTCTLKGTIVDRKSDTLMLKRINEDWRFVKIFIPIVDGKFEYKMHVKDMEAWDLTFLDEYNNGGRRPIMFFPDQKKVRFELYPRDQSEKNKITGGSLNQSFIDYDNTLKERYYSRYAPIQRIEDSLKRNHRYWTSDWEQISAKFNSAKSNPERDSILKLKEVLALEGNDKTPSAREIENQVKKLNREVVKYRLNFIRNNTNILSYSFILEDLLWSQFNSVEVKDIHEVYPAFAKKFPEHPYTQLISDILSGYENIRVGGHIIDFTLPDLNGEKHTLSELIKGKIAVIDLWATWCGPCIKHSREMLPVFNDYHDRGFTIVGVAAEIKDTKAMKNQLDKEKWPWINLVELDHQNHIWDKYGASFGGGKIILVDRMGVVLAINPTADEVREKLKELL